ncbi:hypothetical protein F5880DRAFT_1516208 [Lentinula raphanica]|nr:hypothetical protein F5880DRAFT_1516208 [Lentinula raphanica]
MRVEFESLPNEILHTIINYAAYDSLSRDASYLFKYATLELRVLSVVNWRLRHLCLPFLFANIKITDTKDAEKLEKYLALLSKFTLVMMIYGQTSVSETILSRNIPQFERLSCVDMRLRNSDGRTVLLKTVLAQPTVTVVLVDSLPDKSMCNDDLSKVLLRSIDQYDAFSPRLQPYLNRGIRVNSLEILEPRGLDEVVNRSDFPVLSGLKKIQLFVRNNPLPTSFLSKLLSTHPTFNELLLLEYPQLSQSVHHTPPFISSFVKESQRHKFIEHFVFTHLVFRRGSIGQSTHEWYVMDLALNAISADMSLVEMLARVASSFPQLKKLTLNLNRHQATYHINDLAPVFGHFSSLQSLHLFMLYRRLDFGNTEFPPLIRTSGATNSDDAKLARVETGLLWFASWVAREARNLDYIFTDSDTVQPWRLLGSFSMKNADRDVSGRIQRFTGGVSLHSEISVETGLLPPGFVPTRTSLA